MTETTPETYEPGATTAGVELECRTERRRGDVTRAHLNGVDGVEAQDDGRTLAVTFLGKAPRHLSPANIRIDGGRRITGIRAVEVQIEREDDPDLDDVMYVTVDRPGDTSTYHLSVVEFDAYDRPGTSPYRGFDPRYTGADFVFWPWCPRDQDCAPSPTEPPAAPEAPVIDYTARDYGRLRRLLLDRMTLTMPDWRERHVPDLGVTMVELLAYLGDQLGYYQDAVATEAYLDTARRRVSVRRHVRLVDYAMHDGCNARTWVVLSVNRTVELGRHEGHGWRFAALDVSRVAPRERPDLPPVISEDTLEALPPGARYEIFEPLGQSGGTLRPARNEIHFYSWGNTECHLPKGATRATLEDTPDRELALEPGDVLLIEEVLGPRTGAPADADPRHRQAVRLTSVTSSVDELYEQPVVEVTWAAEDALAFDVCVSAVGGPECALIEDVSVARGNVVLADHGRDLTFCGAGREHHPVPRVPVPPLSCDPGPYCPDRPDRGPAGDAIAGYLARSRHGELLGEDDVLALRRHVGQAAIDRAGLDHTAPAAGQAAALETLLAQVSYPPLSAASRLRPVLVNSPVTHATAFPRPERVAAAQAALVASIPTRAREELERLRRETLAGQELDDEQLAWLRTLFGRETVDQAGLPDRAARGLRDLIARFDELLAGRLDRLGRLGDRARAGRVLGAAIGWEISQTWGDRYADGLRPGEPGLAGPASAALAQDPREALPVVEAEAADVDGGPAGVWSPRRHLLDAGPRDRFFVGEVGDDGRLSLRFSDEAAMPPPGGELAVSYRVGNGIAGNVGAEAINHLVLCRGRSGAGGTGPSPDRAAAGTGGTGVTGVRNPLPAQGGTEPEPVDQVRRLAPLALRRRRLRAVTAADYAELAGQVAGVRRAAATLRWNGTGQEVHVAVDAAGVAVPPPELLRAVAGHLERFRRIGHDLVVRPAVLVPVDLALTACVEPGHLRGTVRDGLRRAVLALFHPDAVTFGAPVRLSRIVAAASEVAGVTAVRVTRLHRLFRPASGELDEGLLRIGDLEAAQLDDDPDRPENGRLTIDLGGGR